MHATGDGFRTRDTGALYLVGDEVGVGSLGRIVVQGYEVAPPYQGSADFHLEEIGDVRQRGNRFYIQQG